VLQAMGRLFMVPSGLPLFRGTADILSRHLPRRLGPAIVADIHAAASIDKMAYGHAFYFQKSRCCQSAPHPLPLAADAQNPPAHSFPVSTQGCAATTQL